MLSQLRKITENQNVINMWKSIKPWVSAIVLILILRYTGALAGLSGLTQTAMIKSGLMSANPDDASLVKEMFDYGFSIKTLDGKTVDMSEFKGKTIFLNMWATWCGPCRAEMPSIQSLYEKVNTDSIAFIILSLDEEDQPLKVKKYIESKKFSFPVYIAGKLTPQTTINTIPTTFIVGPDGKIAHKGVGMADYDTKSFRKFLTKLSGGTETN
jgi:thiol-disulfide isomerase/thioredoxin